MQRYWPQCNSLGGALSKVIPVSKVTPDRSPGLLGAAQPRSAWTLRPLSALACQRLVSARVV